MKYAFALIATISVCASVGLAAEGADLFAAARAGNYSRVVELLQTSPELIDARTATNEAPLHYVAMGNSVELVPLLVALGADVNAQDAGGHTALHFAVTSDDPAMAQALIAAGADVTIADAQGETPLHRAARRTKIGTLQVLLAAGADVGARNNSGQTPLHVVGSAARDVAQDDPAFVRLLDSAANLLIQAGAQPGWLDNAGTPAWPHASENTGGVRQPSGYPTYASIVSTLQSRAAQYPSICQAVDLGACAGPYGRHIWALNITDNVGVEEDEPGFKYISSMHGDEVVGSQMCLYLIDYLLQNYGVLQRVTDDVNNINIWIIPNMNPDGYEAVTRYNYNGYDLNRSFPEGSGSSPDPNTTTGRPAEVVDVMNWSFAHSFTLAANLHGGSLVFNYPYDNDAMGAVFSPTPDEDLFEYIAEVYASHNLTMWNSTEFTHGITNGAAWYTVDGGMQDWDYRYQGGNENTIELGNTKTPSFSTIPSYWEDNRESMLAYMETCLIGLRGIVTNANTGAPLAATVVIGGRNHNIYSDPVVGDYHRMLLPATYDVTFSATGFSSETYTAVVASGAATRLDIGLGRPTLVSYPNGGESLDANQPATVTWQGSPTAQFHVQYSSNYGETGQSTDDFESGAIGSVYTTGGNAPWTVTTTAYHSATHAARSGAITHSQTTWLKRYATGGPISFWYRVSSEYNYDWFNFYIDGVRLAHRSGTVNWTQYSNTLTAGTHELTWEYVKDAGVNGGSDCVWVDDINVSGDATTWSDVVALTPQGATSASWTPTVLSDNYKIRVQPIFNGGSAWGTWDESNAVFSVVNAPILHGDMNCDGVVNNQDIDSFVQALFG